MENLTIQTSDKYRPRLRQLLRIAGYDDMNEAEGVHDLARFVAEHNLFYPEDIASQFVASRGQSGTKAQQAVSDILRAGFFSDEGVESYACTCAPMMLGLAEISAITTQTQNNTRIVLGSADIANLGGLNEIFPDRKKTAPLLEHLIHRPREAIDAWAEAHGYHVDILIARDGGDEFKYVLRFCTNNGDTIDDEIFAHDIRELNAYVVRVNEACAREYGVDQVPHYKHGRAPGVVNTMALRPLDAQTPDIEHTLIELGRDIAALRQDRAAHMSPHARGFTIDVVSLPENSPAPHHALLPANPYATTTLQPDPHESLEHYSLRMALEHAGFEELAAQEGLFTYNTKRRWDELNEQNPAFMALSNEDQHIVRGILEAERLRGVLDPVSRSYSAAFIDQCRDLAQYQGKQKELVVHLKNLGGMNLLGDLLGDAVLREVGGVIDDAYSAHLASGDDTHKPMVVRQNGGEFVVFFDKNINEYAVRDFSKAVRAGVDAINETRIDDFAKRHRIGDALSKSAINGYTVIGDIHCPRNDAYGANFGLEVEFLKGKKHEHTEESTWQNFVQTRPAKHQFIRSPSPSTTR